MQLNIVRIGKHVRKFCPGAWVVGYVVVDGSKEYTIKLFSLFVQSWVVRGAIKNSGIEFPTNVCARVCCRLLFIIGEMFARETTSKTSFCEGLCNVVCSPSTKRDSSG